MRLWLAVGVAAVGACLKEEPEPAIVGELY